MPDPVLVIDLDGTILRGNSYRLWVRHLLLGPFSHLSIRERLGLRLRTIRLLASRKLLRWHHARVKGELRLLWAQAVRSDMNGAEIAILLACLKADVRAWFKPVLERVAAGQLDAIAATAAAGEYAVPFMQQLGFSEILATTSAPALYQENLGEAKAHAVAALVQARGWEQRPLLVLTDHRDDLPLIRMGTGLVWFGDSDAHRAIADMTPGLRAISYDRVDGTEFLARLDSTGSL